MGAAIKTAIITGCVMLPIAVPADAAPIDPSRHLKERSDHVIEILFAPRGRGTETPF
jgi:hypothetical protein